LSRRIREDLFACELTLSLFSVAANSYRKETVTSPLPFLAPIGQVGNVLARILLVLDSLPHLTTLEDPVKISSLSQIQLAVLASLLIAPRVRLKTITKSNMNKSLHHGAWAEVQVIQQVHDFGFDRLRHEHGVRVAFHGSSVENWYSITHRGLRNMSQTRHERHGAAFGEGVYLSTDAALSREFSKNKVERHRLHRSSALRQYSMTKLEERPEFPFEIVAQCSVINHQSNLVPPLGGDWNSSSTNGASSSNVDYLVVKDESHISIDSLLIFTSIKFRESTGLEAVEFSPVNTLPQDQPKPFGKLFYPLFAVVFLLVVVTFYVSM
jgi:hypothetical protein